MRAVIFSIILSICSLPTYGEVQTYFSTNKQLSRQIISEIDACDASIQVAVMNFTNIRIANALVRAKKRGVNVEVILNHTRKKSSAINKLKASGIQVFTYKGKRKGLMHHKFCILHSKQESKVWSGSYNFTYSESFGSKENAIVTTDKLAINAYLKEFEHLKSLSSI